MSASGKFFEGTTLGDASSAPYSDAEWATVFSYFGNFVIPDYLNELNPTGAGGVGDVNVASGAAMVFGALYINDASKAVHITNGDGANPRIDLIVLSFVDALTQTVRLTHYPGAAAANPSIPTLNAFDFPIAWVWVPTGFNAATTAVADENVHDMREFYKLGLNEDARENLLSNSEFCVYSGGNVTRAPDEWVLTAVPPTTIAEAAILNSQPRGQSVNIQHATAGNGMFRYVGPLVPEKLYTLKGLINITSGSVKVQLAGGVTTVTKIFYMTGSDIEYTIRFKPLAGFAYVNIFIQTNGGAGNNFNAGQQLLVKGHTPGNFRPIHEIVMTDYTVTAPDWNFTAKSTGASFINLAGNFNSNFAPYVRGAIVKLRGRDSGSAANTNVALHTYHYNATVVSRVSSVYVDGITNDQLLERIAYAPVVHGSANAEIGLDVQATGVGTFDASITIMGIIT